jgi:xylulokinase
MGTAEALTLVMSTAKPSPALLEAGVAQGVVQVDRPLSYLFGGLPTSGGAVEWFRALFGQPDYATLIAEAETVRPGAHEVMFLPQLRIGSPPFPDPIGRGGFIGISDGCDRAVLFRAVLEGLALDVANQLTLMRSRTGTAVTRIIASGGGTRNRLLMRLKADLFGMPIEIAATPESTCLGAALLGGLAAGLYPDLATARANLPSARSVVEPDPAWPASERVRRLELYAEAYAAIRALGARLRVTP